MLRTHVGLDSLVLVARGAAAKHKVEAIAAHALLDEGSAGRHHLVLEGARDGLVQVRREVHEIGARHHHRKQLAHLRLGALRLGLGEEPAASSSGDGGVGLGERLPDDAGGDAKRRDGLARERGALVHLPLEDALPDEVGGVQHGEAVPVHLLQLREQLRLCGRLG
eukprot:1188882-Prorocentrum_minimum.AAC.4